MKSFSNTVKEEMAQTALKSKIKTCCAFSLIYGIMSFSKEKDGILNAKSANAKNAELFEKVCSVLNKKKKFFYASKGGELLIESSVIMFSTFAEYKDELFRCQHCAEYYLMGMFLSHGTVNNPEKSYRLEFVLDKKEDLYTASSLLAMCGIELKSGERNGKYILYTKESEKIENFFAMTGANNATFELINKQIVKELRNNANRARNCDAANINKSIAAASKYVSIIEELMKSGDFELMNEQLKDAAIKRIKYREIGFEELGKKFTPPISKSGVYHRLEKIVDFYEKTRNEKDKD